MTTTWDFDVAPDAVVVTTTYVTQQRMPVLYVTHEHDADEGTIWQFHAGNGDYSAEVLQLVRLDEILAIDPGLRVLSGLPMGHSASRANRNEPWTARPGTSQ